MQAFANKSARGPTSALIAVAAALTLLFGVSITSTQALAQDATPVTQVDRDQVVKLLNARYGEEPVARGLTSTGWMMEVFATDDGATWTMVMTSPKGISQVASSGVAWQDVKPPLGRLSNYELSN